MIKKKKKIKMSIGKAFAVCLLEQYMAQCAQVKGKGKGHPITGHEDPDGEQMYNSTLPLTLELYGGG